jgi:hypothetical protein
MMQNLFYPAVLGGAFLLTLQALAAHPVAVTREHWTLLYAIVLIVCFTLSYLTNHFLDRAKYTAWVFLLDLVEIVIIFFVFWAMRFIADVSSTPAPPIWWLLYLLLAAIPGIEWLWDRCAGYPRPIPTIWVVGLILVLVGMAVVEAVGFRWQLLRVLVLAPIFFVLSWWWRTLLFDVGLKKRILPARGT